MISDVLFNLRKVVHIRSPFGYRNYISFMLNAKMATIVDCEVIHIANEIFNLQKNYQKCITIVMILSYAEVS